MTFGADRVLSLRDGPGRGQRSTRKSVIGVRSVVTSLPRTGSKHRAALRPLQLVGVVRPGRAIAKRNPIGPLFSRFLLHARLLLFDGNDGSLLTMMEVADDPHRLTRSKDVPRLPSLFDLVQSHLQFCHDLG